MLFYLTTLGGAKLLREDMTWAWVQGSRIMGPKRGLVALGFVRNVLGHVPKARVD